MRRACGGILFVRYLRDLFGNTWGLVLLLAGFISTAATFVSLYYPAFHLPRWILIAVAVVAFLLAPFRLYVSQQKRIATLEASVQPPRKANLVLKPEPGGFYIRMVDNRTHRQVTGLYVEPHVTIENKGPRPATIEFYDLDFPEVPEFQILEKVRPNPVNEIQGLEATHMVGTGTEFVRGYVEVGAERLVGPLRIQFIVPGLLISSHPLKCNLTIRDTENNKASIALVLHQHG